jgi:hypothetical protein
MHISSAVTYQACMHGVMASNPGQVNLFSFHAVLILLFYNTQSALLLYCLKTSGLGHAKESDQVCSAL